MQLRVAAFVYNSVADGPGLRTVVFFQGCQHACPGCHNPHTWDLDGGQRYDLDEFVAGLRDDPLTAGLTCSGGEPFLQAEAAAALSRHYKSAGKDVWVYTGFRWEDLVARVQTPGYRDLIELADVIVDGPFVRASRDPDLAFRGSDNQRLVDVPASLRSGRIVEWVSE